MHVDAIDTSQRSQVSQNLTANYAKTMAMVRRPAIGDVLRIDGGVAQVLSIGKGGITIDVVDAEGNIKTFSREPTGWWTRA